MASGIRLEPVSMGKGFVEWHVKYPSLVKKNPALGSAYDDLASACLALKRSLLRAQVEDETATMIEEYATDCEWGCDRN